MTRYGADRSRKDQFTDETVAMEMDRPSSMNEVPMEVPRVALTWAPDGKRKRGWPKMTWTSTAFKELEDIGHSSWSQPVAVASDWGRWWDLVSGHISHREKIQCLP